ncbi:hypothetical protein [Moraxella sp.]|uniref:hypothetical protein n=1 Tax=Moraxella sp. TaxID=479 RepID=UPI0026DDB2A1|nr:hypothetical protein [Moraxella sp.]MDO4894922.1 hypothetical protein [Moraxella sp.]
MANFSPSIYFAKHWLNTPDSVKTAFKHELNDIIRLLDGDESVAEFEFTNADFDQTINTLLYADDAFASHTPPNRLVHSIDTTALTEPTQTIAAAELSTLEHHLYQKLSSQIDGFLGEHMAQLSSDLRLWLQTTIKNELANYKR